MTAAARRRGITSSASAARRRTTWAKWLREDADDRAARQPHDELPAHAAALHRAYAAGLREEDRRHARAGRGAGADGLCALGRADTASGRRAEGARRPQGRPRRDVCVELPPSPGG